MIWQVLFNLYSYQSLNSYLQATHWEAVLPYRVPVLYHDAVTKVADCKNFEVRVISLDTAVHKTIGDLRQDGREMVHWQVHPARPTPHGIRKTLPTVPPANSTDSEAGLEPGLHYRWLG